MQTNPPHDYAYWTNCVNSVGELINEMRDLDAEREVTYETMLAHCEGLLSWAQNNGYELRVTSGSGLTLKSDPYVSFHRSLYCGVPCYYVIWSGIEYIWIKKGFELEVTNCEDTARATARPSTSLLAQDNPADLGKLRHTVRNISVYDYETGETRSLDGWSVDAIVELLNPSLVLSRDSLEYRSSFGFDPRYIKKPSLAYAYRVVITGDAGIQTFNQIGLVAETSKMICGSFSLPAGSPAAGGCCILSSTKKPQICADCYAKSAHYLYPSKLIGSEAVRSWVVKMLAEGGPEYFGDVLATLIDDYYSRTHSEKSSKMRMNPHYFRIHDAGDFGWYGPDYYKAWVNAARLQPHIRFWAPTRDHHASRMLRAFQAIERPENFVLRPSALRFQEPAPNVAGLDAGSCSAYTADGLPDPMDLCDYDCPAYRGTGHCESENCRVCWENPDVSVNYTPHNTTSTTNIPLLRKIHG